MCDKKYNGWPNWETWNLFVHWDGECPLDVSWFITDDINEEHIKSAVISNLAEDLENLVDEQNPITESSFYYDIIREAIHTVDFEELAKTFIEDYINNNPIEEEESDE